METIELEPSDTEKGDGETSMVSNQKSNKASSKHKSSKYRDKMGTQNERTREYLGLNKKKKKKDK